MPAWMTGTIHGYDSRLPSYNAPEQKLYKNKLHEIYLSVTHCCTFE